MKTPLVSVNEATALHIAKRFLDGLVVVQGFLHAGGAPVDALLAGAEKAIDALLNGSDVDVDAVLAQLKTTFAKNDAAADAAIAAKFGAPAAATEAK